MSEIYSFFQDELNDRVLLLSAIDGYAEGFGLKGIDINTGIVDGIIRGMRAEFPANGGLAQASAFKKAANFFCYFVADRPISTKFPAEAIGELSELENHQNIMTAYHIVVSCLHKATVKKSGEVIILDEPIKLSAHSYADFIEACKAITPSSHFHLMSVFFEQLAYRFNPDASNDLII